MGHNRWKEAAENIERRGFFSKEKEYQEKVRNSEEKENKKQEKEKEEV
jgi:hypothetical protein